MPHEDCCETPWVHQETVAQVREKSLSADEITGLAEIFKALGDQTRIKILHALFQNELCVCDLAEVIGLTQSAVSHQLRLLHNLRLVKRRKEGKQVFYSLHDDHVMNLFAQGLTHIRHN